MHENELFDGTQPSQTRCTAGDCADLSPKAEELEVRAVRQAVVIDKTDAVEINGDCNPSTYPKNKIRVQAVSSTGAQFASGNAVCRQGRFNIVISRVSGSTLINCGKVYLTQIGMDDADKEYLNPNARPFDVSFTVVATNGTPVQFCN